MMLSVSGSWALVGLMVLGARGSSADAIRHDSSYNVSSFSPASTSEGATTLSVPVVHYNTSSCDETTTSSMSTFVSYSTTVAECENGTTVTIEKPYTVTVISEHPYTTTLLDTTTLLETVTSKTVQPTTTTLVETVTYKTTIPTTTTLVQVVTYKTTESSLSITTTTVPTTVTSFTSFTSFTTTTTTTTRNSCDATCSVYAGTVELFFWPTNNDFSYPATYVDTRLDYTFTSPSVYMLINTIYGYNTSNGAVVGPSATSTIFPFDLTEVSTIVGGTVTQQLSLSDLGTDCPTTADPSAIATMVDSRCDPILAAPTKIRSWAEPCAACHRFGLFDPPYAVPTLTGGLVETTTVAETTTVPITTATTKATATAVPTTTTPTTVVTVPASSAADTSVAETTATAAPTSIANSGTTTEVISAGPSGVVIVKYFSGTSVTSTIPPPTSGATTVIAGDQTFTLSSGQSSVVTGVIVTVPSAIASGATTTTIPSESSAAVTLDPSQSTSVSDATNGPSTTTASADPVATAAGSKIIRGSAHLLSGILVAILL